MCVPRMHIHSENWIVIVKTLFIYHDSPDPTRYKLQLRELEWIGIHIPLYTNMYCNMNACMPVHNLSQNQFYNWISRNNNKFDYLFDIWKSYNFCQYCWFAEKNKLF